MRPWPIALLVLAGCTPEEGDDSLPPEGDTDSDADSDTDADSDADSDADADWSWCPEASAWVGDPTWEGRVEAGARALYCGSSSEARTLEEELAMKGQLRIAEGSYPLALEDGAWDYALPACALLPGDAGNLALSGAGRLDVSSSTWHGSTYWSFGLEEPFEAWTMAASFSLAAEEGAEPGPVSLDGGASPDGGLAVALQLYPEGSEPWSAEALSFGPCADEDWTEYRHEIAFEGGEVTLLLQVGTSMASTEPAAFVHAEGTLDGVPFAQDDYWKLVYNPEHHHFERHFAVLFDAPVGAACALRVEGVDPWGEPPAATVHTADCDLAPIEARAVRSESCSSG